MSTMLEVIGLKKYFNVANGGLLHAVDNVSFRIEGGETLGIVGESGCGKSTTGRIINHLLVPDSGEVWFQGKEISKISQDEMRPLRKDMQMIFQDPAGSLNPRMRVSELIEEPLLIHTEMNAEERGKVVAELLGIADNDEVVLYNDAHVCKAKAFVTDRIVPTAVYLSLSFGRTAERQRTAAGKGTNPLLFSEELVMDRYGDLCIQEACVGVWTEKEGA